MVEKFSRQDQQRFREILITFQGIKIIGGSAVVLESFYRYDKPFFDFFKIVQLGPLTSEEVNKLLLRLGEKHNSEHIKDIVKYQHQRIDAMRILTGGVPRTIVLLFNIFLYSDPGKNIEDLTTLLDRVTPLYKHRMDELPSQQQEIVDKLALNWDGMTVSELVTQTRMESKAVSAQLNYLVKRGVVNSVKSSSKNRYYQLEERFFNIWYLMQHAPMRSRQKVIWLTRFLEIWFPGGLLEKTAAEFALRITTENMSQEYIQTMVHAFARAQNLPYHTRDEIITSAKSVLENYVAELRMSFGDFLPMLQVLIHQQKYRDAHSLVNNASLPDALSFSLQGFIEFKSGHPEKAKILYEKAISKGENSALFNMALLYHTHFEDYERAEKYYLLAAKTGDSNAMLNLAILYENHFNDIKKAEKYFLLAASKENKQSFLSLGILYQDRLKDYMKAEEYYLKAIDRGIIGAMSNIAYLYQTSLHDIKKAERYYLMALINGDGSAHYNLAKFYAEIINDFEKAREHYLIASGKGDTKATNNLGVLYQYHFNDPEEAEALYKEAAGKGNFKAYNNLAILYQNHFKDYENAEKFYLMALQGDEASAATDIASFYETIKKDFQKAKKYYKLAASKGDSKAMNNLGLLYYNEFHDYQKAEQYLLMAANKGDTKGMYNMIAFVMDKNKLEYEQDVRKWISDLAKTMSDDEIKMIEVTYFLWTNEIEGAIQLLESILPKIINDENIMMQTSDIIVFAIAKGLRQYIYNLFQNEQYMLRDRFKVLYYALIMIMENEYHDEIKRMGRELVEPVNEMVAYIRKMEEEYL
ncbi:MAG: SEL1-like repeat protein [Bacteroidetes bacterium]|nr:SEL1-like repeat protein [Bacteroidota bacterium]